MFILTQAWMKKEEGWVWRQQPQPRKTLTAVERPTGSPDPGRGDG